MRIEMESFATEAYTREQTLSLLTSPNSIGLMAKVNGEVAGFIIGMVESNGRVNVGHVFTIDIAVKYRRKGFGILLLQELEGAFVKKGAAVSYLEVRVKNQAARRLYQKQGYVEVETLRDYYSPGVHGVRLKKELRLKQSVSSEG